MLERKKKEAETIARKAHASGCGLADKESCDDEISWTTWAEGTRLVANYEAEARLRRSLL